MVEARKKLDTYDWTGAIEEIGAMSSRYRTRRDVKYLLASAYVGRCGLIFFDVAERIQNPGTSNLFEILVDLFPGATAAQVTDCQTAELTMTTIATDATGRTDDENILAAFIGLAKAAVYVSRNLDLNANGDGVDDAVDPCGAISDGDAAEIAVGLVTAINSLQQVGGTIGSTLTANVTAMCDAIELIDPTYNICNVTDTSSVTMEFRQLTRGMIRETDDGVGLRIVAGDSFGARCGT